MGKLTLFFYLLLLFLLTSTPLDDIVRIDHSLPYFLVPILFCVLAVCFFLSYNSCADPDCQESFEIVRLFFMAGFRLFFNESHLFIVLLIGWYMCIKKVSWWLRTLWGFHAFFHYFKIRGRFGDLYLFLFTGYISTKAFGRRGQPHNTRTAENQNVTNATAQGSQTRSSAQKTTGLGNDAKVTESAPSGLTFGIELEFIVKIRGTDLDPKQILNTNYKFPTYQRIAQVLRSAGLEVYDPKETQIPHTYTPREYEKWNIDEDSTLRHREEFPDGFQYIGVEVISPVLPANEMGFVEVRKAIAALHEVEDKDLSFFINGTCGLHVHVGNGTSSYELGTLKNLCTLVTVFESQISAIHPASRAQGDWAWTNCAPPSRIRSFQGKSSQECTRMIDKIGSVGALIELMNPSTSRFVATNLMALDIRTTNTDKNGVTRVGGTVEFRQHAGSLDADEVVTWVLVTTGLVQAAGTIDERYLKALLSHSPPAGFQTTDFLCLIGRSEVIEYYKRRLHDYPNTPFKPP